VTPPAAPTRATLGLATLALFLVWSNSFVAMSYLLGTERAGARLDWRTLTTARFAPVTVLAAAYAFGAHRTAAVAALRAHGGRLLCCGLLSVPVYSAALYWGMQQGVPAPIASVTTSVSPLFLLLLGAGFLGERLTARAVAGFVLCCAGLALIAWAREGGTGGGLAPVLVAACAPAAWAVHTALSKPVSGQVAPLLWTALYLLVGGAPLLLVLPWVGGRELLALDGAGWGAVLYLSIGCTVFGFGAWSWLLRHLPASTVGLTVFLNPPLTFVSKAVLAAALPGVFVFQTTAAEAAGSAVVLGGLAVALMGWRPGPGAAAASRAAPGSTARP
jgi:O-acetylserine/cysteine efflux transporter